MKKIKICRNSKKNHRNRPELRHRESLILAAIFQS